MAIWVDADACPNVIKEILFRAAERVQMPLTLVANQNIRVPPSRFIRSLRVPAGFDVADNEIVRLCSPEGRTACPSAIASSLLPNWINGCWK